MFIYVWASFGKILWLEIVVFHVQRVNWIVRDKAEVLQYSLLSRPVWHTYNFVSHRISVEGLEAEIRQVAADIKKLDSQLTEDKNGIRSYFKGKFTYQLWI